MTSPVMAAPAGNSARPVYEHANVSKYYGERGVVALEGA